jgi:hypothetical protein
MFVENLVQRRQTSIKNAFPDALDMLLICVQSGMSVEAGFGKVASEVGSQSLELAEELSLTTAELSYSQERRQANLGERTGIAGIKAVATALIQAERYGPPVGQALRVMARENRDMRMAEAEKKAAALPPKLTVPMIYPCCSSSSWAGHHPGVQIQLDFEQSEVRRRQCASAGPLASAILRCGGAFAQKRLHTPARKRVGPFVLDVTRVALKPMPGDLMARLGRIKALPQLDVLYRLFVGRLPAAPLPAFDPGADAVAYVL